MTVASCTVIWTGCRELRQLSTNSAWPRYSVAIVPKESFSTGVSGWPSKQNYEKRVFLLLALLPVNVLFTFFLFTAVDNRRTTVRR